MSVDTGKAKRLSKKKSKLFLHKNFIVLRWPGIIKRFNTLIEH